MINYYCPGFYTGKQLYQKIFFLKEKNPEIFNLDVNIKAIFGSFPCMIWNGGSTHLGNIENITNIKSIIEGYKKLNVQLQLTCTNPLLKKEHLNDIYCNKILDLWSKTENSVLVASPILEEYLRNKYPYLKIDRSVVNTHHDLDWENILDTKYNNIVMPRRYSKDFEYLSQIKKQYRNRIEIICNDKCPINCKRIDFHYHEFAKYTLFQQDEKLTLECTNLERKKSPFLNYKKDEISYEDIINKYLPLGYTEFKLTGRLNPVTISASIIPYLFKQEYQIDSIPFLLMG